MPDEFSPELRKELLDDFYAECDELLGSVRSDLDALEQDLEKGRLDFSRIESLFRHVHSVKGISAIVGLRPAEELAHAMEDLLRGLSKRQVVLTLPGIDALLAAAQRLERIVTAHRLGHALPEAGELGSRLRRLAQPRADVSAAAGAGGSAPPEAGSPDRASPASTREDPASADSEPAAAAAPDPSDDPVRRARSRGLRPWRFSFSPTSALDRRGINVTAVRERLARAGEILGARPQVQPQGAILFEFDVALREDPADLAEWERDGIQGEALPDGPPIGKTADFPTEKAADPPGAAREAGNTGPLSLTPSHIVRVDLARLDDLMRITGEMMVHRFRLEDRLASKAGAAEGLAEISLALGRSLREMREAISRVRLVPIAEIFTRMPLVVRDLARESGRKVRVTLEGRQTEIDKYVVERLKEPLLHLVRNAFTHGIESTAERIAAGKPPEAAILLRATGAGESIVIQIRDDGRGIDPAAIAARAARLGLAVPARLDSNGVLQVLCLPGFSTRDYADRAAGRGVGMAVVANAVRELGGTLALDSQIGAGTQFTLRLPLTLSIADAIIVSVGAETCAVPQSAVEEIFQVPTHEVRTLGRTEVVPHRGGLLPIARLRTLFRLGAPPGELLTVLVVAAERGATGLAVDRVHAQREIVIRPLTDPLLRAPGIAGATELGDGRPILILDPVAITAGVVRPLANSAPASAPRLAEPLAS